MAAKHTATRIVSFLGLSSNPTPPHYDEVPYEIERFSGGGTVRTARTALKDVATVLATEGPCSLLMLGTSDTRGQWFGPEPLFPKELRKGLDASPGGSERHPLLGFQEIPVGKDREQRWQIFQTLVDALQPTPLSLAYNEHPARQEPQPPEEIVLDITHGFRSAPFFAASAVAFQRSEQRRLGLSGPRFRIVYAHYEPKKFREKPDSYVAPIWYFDDLVEVLDWNTAIDDLMRHGRADELEQRVRASQVEATRAARKEGLDFPKLQQFGRAARSFADGLATARIPGTVTELSVGLVKAIQSCREDLVRHIPPLAPQLDRLEAQARKLSAPAVVSPEGIRASLELAGYYMELQRYAEAAITLRETGISACSVELAGERVLQPHHGDARMQERGDKGFREERERHEQHLSDGKKSAGDTGAMGQLRRLMRDIADLRNDVEHGGFREQSREGNGIRGELKEKLDRFGKLYPPSGQGHQERDDASPAGGGVFLNLSNHGVSTWSQEQREAARALGLGEPADLPGGMPLVAPEADTDEVSALAEELAWRAVAQGARGAHVAGEFTLTLALVRALQGRGIPCYAATTHREVEEHAGPDGETQKLVKFRFTRWRLYG
jgi:CRISPR-associated protein Csx16